MTDAARVALKEAIDKIIRLDDAKVNYSGIHFRSDREAVVNLYAPGYARKYSSFPNEGAIYDPAFSYLNRELTVLLSSEEEETA